MITMRDSGNGNWNHLGGMILSLAVLLGVGVMDVEVARGVTGTGNPPAGANGTASGGMFPAVGKLSITKDADGKGPFLGSGTLVGPMHMLTAAHNFSVGPNPKTGRQSVVGTAMFQVPKMGGGTMMLNFDFMRVSINPGWDGAFANNDLALVKLKQNVPTSANGGIDPMALFMGSNEANMPVTIVGWGATTDGTSGTKRHGSNEIDTSNGNGGKRLDGDFDADGTDVGTGAGDSGGAWIKNGQLAGVHTGITGPGAGGRSVAAHGDGLVAQRVSQYKAWINQVINEPQISNFSGSWRIEKETFIPSTDANAHFGMDTVNIEESVNSMSPFDIEISIMNIPEGESKVISVDKKITNNLGFKMSDFHMTVGTGVGAGFTESGESDFLSFFGPETEFAPRDTMGKFPDLQVEPGEEFAPDNLNFFGELDQGEMAKFWTAIEVPDMIDGKADGMASFTIRQRPTSEFNHNGIICGDVNGDGVLNNQDIQPFIDLLVASPDNPTFVQLLRADKNMDGVLNNQDISGFVDALLAAGGGGTPEFARLQELAAAVPEPGTACVLVLGGLIGLGYRGRRKAA